MYQSPKHQSLFRNDDFRNLYLEHNSGEHACTAGQYKYFCCGSVYKNNELFRNNPHTLQIQVYTDDFETCNPLQSKKGIHKLCAVYFQIKNLPVRVQSKLNNIFFVSLCHSDDINKSTQSDFNNIWEVIVRDIKQLETDGIDIGSMKIKGTICWPSFDNLGANVSLGYAAGFTASYFCRFCECDSTECKTMTEERESKVRTREKYASCVKVAESLEVIDYRQTLGVRRYCLLNELNYFHITENISADILHDVYEGAMPFSLKLIINFMVASKIVNKNEFIKMVEYYDYGELHRMNKPSILLLDKTNLGQNGSQSKCLFLHFPFICAKFKSDERLTSVWRNFESLARITQIIHSTDINENDLDELNDSVFVLLDSIQNDFNAKLIPKLHNLLHYARIIRSMGPVVHMNTMRYESKHKVLKRIVQQSPNFENICKTIAYRHQQEISITDFGLRDEITCGIKQSLTTHSCGEDEYLLNILRSNDSIHEMKYLRLNNYIYKKEFFIINTGDIFEIQRILVIDEEFYLYCLQYELTEFVSFYNAYKIASKLPSQKKTYSF